MEQNRRLVALFLGPDMDNENEKARKSLAALHDQVEIEEVSFLGAKEPLFAYPFIRDEEEKIPYYGLDGIEFFIRRLKNRSGNNTQYNNLLPNA